MNVYDFDNTLYDGESVVDFFLFLLNKKKHLAVFLPIVAYVAFLYKIRKLDIEQIYQLANKFSFVVKKHKDEAEAFIREFWLCNIHKLKFDLIKYVKEDDVIITASPNLLIQPILPYLRAKNIIASDYQLEQGKLNFICIGKNKVIAFKKSFPDARINNFFTDSLNDMPLINLANNVYMVRGERMFCLKKNCTIVKRRLVHKKK